VEFTKEVRGFINGKPMDRFAGNQIAALKMFVLGFQGSKDNFGGRQTESAGDALFCRVSVFVRAFVLRRLVLRPNH